MDVQKIQKGRPPFTFLVLCDPPETSKFFFLNSEKLFPQFIVFWEVLLSLVVEKVVFESY